MDVKVEAISPVKKRVSITVEPERVRKARASIVTTLKKQVQMRGFRPGKTPASLIERRYGDAIDEQLRDDLLREGLQEANKDGELRIIAEPEIESADPSDDGGFALVATFETMPAFEPADYNGIATRRVRVAVTDDELEQQLEHLASHKAVMEPIDPPRPAAIGDFVEIDFVTRTGETPPDAEPQKIENHLIELTPDGGFMPPGFNDAIAGMTPGESKSFDLAFGDDAGRPHLRGRSFHFDVDLKAVKKRVVPDVDDELARDFGFESLDELRRIQKQHLETDKRRRLRGRDRQYLLDALLAKNDVPAPDIIVRRQMESMKARMRQDLAQSGMPGHEADMLAGEAMPEQKENAVREVKALLLFDAIAEKENIAVSDEEVRRHIEESATRMNRSAAEIAAFYQKEGLLDDLKSRLRDEKVLDFLLDNANVDWIDPEDDENASETDDDLA
ncbi:trigger factor [bacterium]|nr:trigger factor [bacterium]